MSCSRVPQWRGYSSDRRFLSQVFPAHPGISAAQRYCMPIDGWPSSTACFTIKVFNSHIPFVFHWNGFMLYFLQSKWQIASIHATLFSKITKIHYLGTPKLHSLELPNTLNHSSWHQIWWITFVRHNNQHTVWWKEKWLGLHLGEGSNTSI